MQAVTIRRKKLTMEAPAERGALLSALPFVGHFTLVIGITANRPHAIGIGHMQFVQLELRGNRLSHIML
jgi:hypothetical protein